ncbi:MAG: S24 family peptidase [Butyrivibrio sp.]
MLGQRLRNILNSKNISISEFAEMCDLSVETVKNVYYGKTPDPKVSTVLKMSDALQTSVNCLMGHCEHTVEERAILQHYRMCGNYGKSLIELVAKYEALTAKEEREAADRHRIPCLIAVGNLNEGIEYDSSKVEEIETTVKDAYVGIELTTNDFVPVYCKGDVILLANRFPKSEEYAVFYKGGKAYIRQFIDEGKSYRLKSIHNMFEDRVFQRMDQIEYIGTCIGVIRT